MKNIIILSFFLFLMACNNAISTQDKNQIIGTWDLVNPVPLSSTTLLDGKTAVEITKFHIEFTESDNFVLTIAETGLFDQERTEGGKYTIDGNKIIIEQPTFLIGGANVLVISEEGFLKLSFKLLSDDIELKLKKIK